MARIVILKAQAFSMLIDCFTNGRRTSAILDTRGKEIRVPVGFVCLDILSGMISNAEPMFIDERSPTEKRRHEEPYCSYDGMGACFNSGYYFRPEDFSPDGAPNSKVLIAQRKWRKALRSGKLKYRDPFAWKKN